MAIHGSTLPSAGSLNDLDLLADSNVDLASWLFPDDLYQPDFGRGAKDVHSISSTGAGHASPSFITSQDLPDWMEASTDINWDQPLLEEVLKTDLKQQAQQPYASLDNLPTEFTPELFVDLNPPEEIFAPQQQFECQKVFVQKNETKDVAYSQDGFSSPERFENSFSPFNSSEENFNVDDEKASPYIISVPLSEVFADQKPPVFKTINITGIERIDVAQKPVFCSTPIQSVASLPQNERREPQKIVINLRRVVIPAPNCSAPRVEVVPPVEVQPQAAPTLKEVLSRGDADDFIRDMVTMPTVVSAQPFEADRQEDSVLQSSVDFDDSGFPEGFDSPSQQSFLYSPSSSSGQSSACGSVHSYEAYDGNSSQDDGMEDDLSEDVACGSGGKSPSPGLGESSRYAPYKSLEKKLRKKEQNKRAALRYRQKKKEEEEVVLTTLQKEEQRQKQLNDKYTALQMEVKLMKKLMREMLVSKGTLKK